MMSADSKSTILSSGALRAHPERARIACEMRGATPLHAGNAKRA